MRGAFGISAEIASVGGRLWVISGSLNVALSAAIVTSQAVAIAQPKIGSWFELGTIERAAMETAGISLVDRGLNEVRIREVLDPATAIMATCGTLLGRWAGPVLGRYAEFAGGVGLMALGLKILLEHMLG